ncbi:MAG: glycosyltransferase family 9 protein [Bacillota bacterium]
MNGKPKIMVKRIGGAGDVLLTTPVLKALKEKYPTSRLTFVVSQYGSEVIKDHPLIDEIITCPHGYEEVLDYRREGEDLIYTLWYENRPDQHIVDAYALCAGVKLASRQYIIQLGEDDRNAAKKLLLQTDAPPNALNRPLIGVHRGPSWPHRMWAPEKFRLVLQFFKNNCGAAVVEFSKTREMYLGEGIDLTGRTTIKQAAAVLAECDLLICIDSLFLHLAGAVQTPVVAVFGCTDPDKRLPFNDISVGVQTKGSCRGCHHRYAGAFNSRCRREKIYCLEEVDPEEVINRAINLLERKGVPRTGTRSR